jgi:RNA polymerase sigma-70 factor (ECF subfamily)
MAIDPDSRLGGPAATRFATTQWSIVLAAGHRSSPDARDALAKLCETYWYPLYAYARQQGHLPADAQDLTQGFFTRLLEKGDLGNVAPELGRFRSFLLASLKHYMINQWHRSRAAKRGGTRTLLPLDFDAAEGRLTREPYHEQTPERLFDRQWALTALDRVRATLRQEAMDAGKADQFDVLQNYLTGDKPAATYAAVAEGLSMTEPAVKMAVSRLRRRFHERLRQEIAQTVQSDAEVEDEIRDLIAALQP